MVRSRKARVADVHAVAAAMPHVSVEGHADDHSVYQVGGKSFVYFRTPSKDAFDTETGARYEDVIIFWVPDEIDKQALVDDDTNPFFTTPHFAGHPSVLLRGSRIGELTLAQLTEMIHDAWCSRASARRVADWLAARQS